MGLFRRCREVPDEIKVSVPLSDPLFLCGRRKSGLEARSRCSRLALPDHLNLGTKDKAYKLDSFLGRCLEDGAGPAAEGGERNPRGDVLAPHKSV